MAGDKAPPKGLFKDESSGLMDEGTLSIGLFEDEFPESISTNPFIDPVEEDIARSLDTYPDQIRQEAQRRLSCIHWFEKRNKAGWTAKNLEPLFEEASKHLEGPLPSWRTLAGWRSVYEKSARSVEALAPKHHRKGNREAKVPGDALYYWRAVNEKYMHTERPTIAAAYEHYKDLIVLANKDLVTGRIEIVSERAFYNRVKKLPPYDVALARDGKRYADKQYQSVGAHIKPTRALERVEIDHTPLDLILLDDELSLPLGRPYLTALVDSYSRCLVGFYLGYKEPSYDSVRKALLNSCLSKDYVKEQYPSVKNEWGCEGKIETLVVDNGAEFWSKNLEHACRAVVSDVQYNPVARPWLKPMVERFFGTINRKLLVSIPGKTFSKIDELKDYNPQKDAVMHFSAFMDIFHKWIVDVYHQSPNSRETNIPSVSWARGVREFPPITYQGDAVERLIIELGQTIHPVLRKGGVVFLDLKYSNEKLTEYRKTNPPPSGDEKLKVVVKVNPSDLSYVYVYLDADQRYIKVPCVDPDGYTDGLTLFQHLTNRQFTKVFIRSQVNMVGLAEARQYIDHRIQAEIEEVKKSGKRKKKQIKGIKSIARHRNIGSDAASSIVKAHEGAPKIASVLEGDRGENQGNDETEDIFDNWDDLVSHLDAY